MLNWTLDPPVVAALLLARVTSLKSGISISLESSRATLSCEYAVPESDRPCAAVVGAVPSELVTGAVMFSVAIVTSSGTTSENSRRILSQAIRVDIAPTIASSRGCSSAVTAGIGMIGLVFADFLTGATERLTSESLPSSSCAAVSFFCSAPACEWAVTKPAARTMITIRPSTEPTTTAGSSLRMFFPPGWESRGRRLTARMAG